MPSAKRGVAYTFDTALADATIAGVLKVNPTLATGDVKISKDGGAFANLATLPVVEPAGGRVVKVALSAAEMTADRVVVQFVDQSSPAEWGEIVIPIQTNLVTVEDIAAFIDTEIAAIKAQTDQLVFTNAGKVDAAVLAAGDFAQAAADKVWTSATRSLTEFSTALAVSVWNVLESAIAVASSIGLKLKTNVDAAVSTRATAAQILTTPGQTLATDGSGRVTVGSNADKAGYKIAADGLDSVAAPADITSDGDARSSLVKMIRALFNRFFNEVRQTNSEQAVRDDGGSVRQTMAVSDDGTTQIKGKSA